MNCLQTGTKIKNSYAIKIFQLYPAHHIGDCLQYCTCGHKKIRTYEIINQSDYPIQIRTYEASHGYDVERKELINISLFQKNDVSWGGSDPSLIWGDSVVMDFANEKRLIYDYSNTLSDRNILYHSQNFEINNMKRRRATYTFTNDDYDLAVECDENCDRLFPDDFLLKKRFHRKLNA